MTTLSITLAKDPTDIDTARALCRDWLDWHWRHYPPDWPKGPDHPMDPDRFEITLQNLTKLHSRPMGGILIGRVDGQAAGCVMYHQAAPGVAEFNRMFVRETGRGHGLGQRMLGAMFDQMKADGYHRVIFSSATFLTHARQMYQAAGFRPMPHPEGFPTEWRDLVYFMDRALD